MQSADCRAVGMDTKLLGLYGALNHVVDLDETLIVALKGTGFKKRRKWLLALYF